MEKIRFKRGISLIVLIITIVIALIILGATIVQINSSMENADIVSFAEDLTIVQDSVNMHYIQNDEIPYIEPEEVFSQNQIVNIIENNKKATFLEELGLNGDKNENGDLGAFYKVDLGKLNVESTTRGTNINGNERDVYIVSFPSMNIYYLNGLDAKNTTFFSLSEKIIKYRKKVTQTTDTSITDIQSSGTISVSKQRKGWSNKMGINLKAYLKSDEALYMNVQDGQDLKITTTTGNNVFFFDGIIDIINGKNNIKVAGLATTDANRLITTPIANRHIDIKKKSGGNVIDTIRIDLSNYDTAAPQIVGNTFSLYTSVDDKNILTSTVKDEDGGSGIKEVRYEFINKYDSTGAVVNYYNNINNLDGAFIKARGKKAVVSKEGKVEISLPKDIAAVQVLVVDNAGNWYKTNSVVTQSPLYIGVVPNRITKSGSTFDLVFNSQKGLNNYSVQLSRDGINFGSNLIFSPNTSDIKYVNSINDYENSYSIDNKIYIKVTATDNNTNISSRITATRVISFTLADDNPSSSLDIPKDWIDISKDTPPTGLSLLVGKPISQAPVTIKFKTTTTEENYKVNWGDGASDTYASGVEATHTYGDGTGNLTSEDLYLYRIDISAETGSVTKFEHTQTVNSPLLWCQVGCDTLTDCNKMLNKCIMLRKFGTASKTSLSNVTTMNQMFYECSSLTEIPYLDTSQVTNMMRMFYGCMNLKTIPLLDTSQVTNMNFIFDGCSKLTTIPKLDTSSVTSMSNMFYGCSSLTTIPLLDTSKVTNTVGMFRECRSLTTIPSLDTSNVTTIYYMFYNCSSLTSIPVLNTAKSDDMDSMFYGCSSLTIIPKLDISQVTYMEWIFSGCSKLSEINIANIGLSSAQINELFYELPTITNGGMIYVTGNPGASGCNRSIATRRGWTVVQ